MRRAKAKNLHARGGCANLFYRHKFIVLRAQSDLFETFQLDKLIFPVQLLEEMTLPAELHALRNAFRDQIFHLDGIDARALNRDDILSAMMPISGTKDGVVMPQQSHSAVICVRMLM